MTVALEWVYVLLVAGCVLLDFAAVMQDLFLLLVVDPHFQRFGLLCTVWFGVSEMRDHHGPSTQCS